MIHFPGASHTYRKARRDKNMHLKLPLLYSIHATCGRTQMTEMPKSLKNTSMLLVHPVHWGRKYPDYDPLEPVTARPPLEGQTEQQPWFPGEGGRTSEKRLFADAASRVKFSSKSVSVAVWELPYMMSASFSDFLTPSPLPAFGSE